MLADWRTCASHSASVEGITATEDRYVETQRHDEAGLPPNAGPQTGDRLAIDRDTEGLDAHDPGLSLHDTA